MFSLGPWHIQIYIGCILGSLSLGWMIYKRSNIVGGLLFFYLMLNSIHTYFLPHFNVPQMGPVVSAMVPTLAAMSMVWIIMLCVPFLIVPSNKLKYVAKVFVFMAFVESLSIIFKLGIDQFKNSGFLLNPAQDGAFVSCLLPLVFRSNKWYRWPLTALMTLAIFLTKASTPLIGLSVFIALELWFSRYKIFAIIGPVVVGLIGLMMQGYVQLTMPNGRWDYIWPLTLKYWWRNLDRLIGAGSGSFFIYGPTIELNHHGFGYTQPVYVWMHSEILQVLFEFGIIGFLLALGFYFSTLITSYKKQSHFSSLLIFGATSCFQMPLRQAVSAIFFIFLLRVIYDEKLGA